MMMRFHLTAVSSNMKTGPMPVSTSSADTCPVSCPLRERECYARFGNLGRHWGKVTRGVRGGTWEQFLLLVRGLPRKTLWRHNQAGDLAGAGDEVDVVRLRQLAAANRGRRGFTYSHKPRTPAVITAMQAACDAGFVVNVSCDTLEAADEARRAGLPAVVTLPRDAPSVLRSPAGNRVVVCHEQTGLQPDCQHCQLCAVAERTVIVGFRAHGSAGARLSRRLEAQEEDATHSQLKTIHKES